MSRRRWEGRASRLQSSVPPGHYEQDPATHYGDYVLDASWQYILHGFATERLDFIISCLGPEEIQRSSFADIGDSDGTFLRALGKDGTSINFSDAVLGNIRNLKTLKGSLPNINLPDGSFDYVLLFETLEHLPDPVAGLREVERLARRAAFVSIPHVKETRFKPYANNPNVPPGESHVFEFCPRDFGTLLSYTRFRVMCARRVKVFAAPRSPSEILYWCFARAVEEANVCCGAFKAFDVYYLQKQPAAPENPQDRS